METEIFDIFFENGQKKGQATRDEVHKMGEWHKTFHCHFIICESDGYYLLFQKRHQDKDSFPNKFDITVGGHLLAGEKPEDGVREIKEELGIDVSFSDLIPIGVMKEEYHSNTFIDLEFCHVFFYLCKIPVEQFILQSDELSGIVKIKMDDFEKLFKGKKDLVIANGYMINSNGEKEQKELFLAHEDFTYKDSSYFVKVIEKINFYLPDLN